MVDFRKGWGVAVLDTHGWSGVAGCHTKDGWFKHVHCNWHGFIIVCLMSWRLYIMHNLYVYLYAKIIKNTTHVGVLDTTVEQVPRCLSKNPVMGLWFASNLGMLKTLVPCSHLTKKIAGNYGCSSLQILGKRCFDPSRPSDDIPSGYD